ncbi:MAG: protein kinase domain-containing protein [Terriglobia bacterium]
MDTERWRKIEQLYHAALESSAGDRTQFLQQACAGDETLRGEVESLLAHEDRAANFLSSPALEVAAKAWAHELTTEECAPEPDRLAGQTVSHYRVLEKLGGGGMGVVYKAEDVRLHRFVALKFLPEAFAQDTDRLVRFKREAQVLASLNHPNIASIHGLEEAGGVLALVMELVEGPTLAGCIKSGAIPVEEALPIAKQIAEALEAAHERGIIHRDLKPANIKITPEGTAKVLDFGLAKALDPQDSAHNPSLLNSLAPRTAPTEAGVILGTAGYMSPEQAKGQRVDRRCDIWAFGCVLYEMVAGRKAFAGETMSETLAAVLKSEPDWSALPETTPISIQKLVRRCLVKDPKQRLQAIGDARITIEETIIGAADAAPDAGRPPSAGDGGATVGGTPALRVDDTSSDRALVATLAKRHKKALLGGQALLVALIAALAYWLVPPPAVSGYVQLTHDALPGYLVGTDGVRLYIDEIGHGYTHHIAQVSVSGGTVAQIPAPSPTMLLLNVSPDGSELLVADMPGLGGGIEGPLWALPTLGGSARRLANTVGHDGAWSRDGQKLVYAKGNALYLANADGTEPRKLVGFPGTARDPAWSPDGSRICFDVGNPKTGPRFIWEVSSEGKNPHLMLPGWHARTGECCGEWTPDGKYFVFDSQWQIWARREAGSLLRKVSRKPVQLTAGTDLYGNPVPSKDGKELFAMAGFRRGKLERYDAKTKTFEPYLGGISAQDVTFSKDGKWVTYVSYPDGTLWRSKADGSDRLQLTFPPLYATLPRWLPDGKEIAYHAFQSGRSPRIYLVSGDGGTPQELMPNDSNPQTNPSWSQDGGSLAFSSLAAGTAAIDIFNMKTHQATTLSTSQGLFSPHWSPDGRYIEAVPSNGRSLMLFDVRSQKWSVLAKGHVGYPCWSRDSQYVYFLRVVGNPAVERVGVRDRKVDQVVSLKAFQMAGNSTARAWLGLTPDDSPLLLKDTGGNEIVALDWHEP